MLLQALQAAGWAGGEEMLDEGGIALAAAFTVLGELSKDSNSDRHHHDSK